MGLNYIAARSIHELKRRTGYLKKKFSPNIVLPDKFISLSEWRKSGVHFFFDHKDALTLPRTQFPELKKFYDNFVDGKLPYFYGELLSVGKDYDWLTNPKTGYQYPVTKHWTELNDFDSKSGDIKYVWEKSRFCYLYYLIRYDYHFEHDLSELVFSEILSWIKANPLNYGPNYICSQEISLRILNWTFALHYYKHSKNLTEEIFNTIIRSIYGQIKHVYANIHFSLKTVRNNHALTETLTLYLMGLLYPFFPEAQLWREKGKRWFEQEINYQIYDDGSYLQFSMNYHRVVIQLLTWALFLSKANNDSFNPVVYEKAQKSLNFLLSFMDRNSGWLPNYGSNDGALFFKLSEGHYRDYRPQLNALHYALSGTHLFNDRTILEDVYWYTGQSNGKFQEVNIPRLARFDAGGFYGMRENDGLTFIRCGKHKDRPAQADNLHLDIWYKGKNILHDSGTFQYNTDPDLSEYFMGTTGHNAVMLGNYHQMLKGPRFIWFYWTQAIDAELSETEDQYIFFGSIKSFTYLNKNIVYQRKVIKEKDKAVWQVEDKIIHKPDLPLIQLWHVFKEDEKRLQIKATDESGDEIKPEIKKGWYSSYYGLKEETLLITFKTSSNKIKTIIKINET